MDRVGCKGGYAMTEPRIDTRTSAPDEPVPSTTIRFFLSSTFVDFQVEPDILQERVFPELRMLCAASGFRLHVNDARPLSVLAVNREMHRLNPE
jgi:hypothetical protein